VRRTKEPWWSWPPTTWLTKLDRAGSLTLNFDRLNEKYFALHSIYDFYFSKSASQRPEPKFVQKKLVLHTLFGLANRLRGIASGISLLQKDEEMSLEVIWNPNPSLAAKYSDLFEPICHPRVRMTNLNNYPIVRAHMNRSRFGWKHRLARASRLIPITQKKSAEAFSRTFPDISLRQSKFAFMSGNTGFLSTCHEFATSPVWEYFIPTPSIMQRIDSVAEKLGPNSVGIHIRRSDNAKSWEKSPLSVFISAIQNTLQEAPQTRFFLATDSPDVQTALIQIFSKEVIITREGISLSRDSISGMEEAVIDMWSLSRTNKILGSYWSSFSEAAASIGGIPFIPCVIED